ncbi:hypothetical protein HC891_04420 [Candidatus Gracilibacteria bacterium]|nr:hypothetical protein [Candidatus Gracilibacteria bacterium]
MDRFLATLHLDIRLQLRNGIYAAVIFVALLTAFAVGVLPGDNRHWLLPPLVLNNLLLTSFYVAAALWLLESDEGALMARAATPLRSGEYLAARGLSLSALALAQSITSVGALTSGAFDLLPLISGSLAAALILSWAGAAAVTRFTAINSFLLPSIPLAAALLLPVIGYIFAWPLWALAWHPLQGPLVLLRAVTAPTDGALLLFAIVASALWCGLSFWIALRCYRRQ